jgi:DNA-binding transcriptional MerR regulator
MGLEKAADAFRTISEVAEELDLQQHVLRFWETRFSQIRPLKRGGGRRYYRPEDVMLLKGIRYLLYGQGYTIKGVQRIIKEGGVRFIQSVWKDGIADLAEGPAAAALADPANRSAGARPDDEQPEDGVGVDRFVPPPSVPRRMRETAEPQGAVLVRKPEPPTLSGADRKALQAALSELTDARRLLELAGRV